MIGSSDEESAPEAPYQDNPAFEEGDTEYDPSDPYEPIVQTLDLPLGVEVLHLAFPQIPANLHPSSLASLPAMLSRRLMVAVACSDFSIRLITVSLMPPSPQSKARLELKNAVFNLNTGKGLFGEEMVVLSSGTTHQSIPKGVSISMTAGMTADDGDINMGEDDRHIEELTTSRRTSRSRSRSSKDQSWDVLVASHSADLSGLLLIHKIPLVEGGASISTEPHIPWRTQRLASPALSVEFSSALFPASRYSQLLVAEAKGAVRILDCLPQSKATHGSWLLALHTDFETRESISRRKPILGARWVLGGKAVLVLLADGKWGVWDHENAGPKPTDVASASSGKSGGFLTVFALEGWVSDALKSKPLLKSSHTKHESRSKLAPMTPGTRKTKQDTLFTGPTTLQDGPVRGGLFVAPFHDATTSRAHDESVLLWHESNVVVIPSLYTHWHKKARRSGNLFGSGAKGEPETFSNIQLGGESCNEASLILRGQENRAPEDPTSQICVLVTGEKRLLIVTSALPEPEAPVAAIPPPLPSFHVDEQLLATGELDVIGIDRILDGMSNGHHTPRRNSQASNTLRNRQNLLLS